MLLFITLLFFCVFTFFQLLYIFLPLYTSKKQQQVNPPTEKGMSVLIPSYNEALIIENCLNGALTVDYDNVEFIFINDGSNDQTLEILHSRLDLQVSSKRPNELMQYEHVREIYHSTTLPKFLVIDKDNGGKADSLNAGIAYATKEIVITLDADSILDIHSLREMNKAFADGSVIAAGGLVNIVQAFSHKESHFSPSFNISGLIKFQVIRYLTGFYMNKTTQSRLGSLTVIAGAFGAFQRSVLIQTKGYRKTVGEDMDITLRIQELIGTELKGKRIVFVHEAICYTECPASFKSLYKQRIRWQKAFIDCMITYRKSLYRKMKFPISTFLLIDSLILGTLSAYSVLLIPFILLFTQTHIILVMFLFSISFSLALTLNIATLFVSRRLGHKYSAKDFLSIILYLPIEIILYRITEVVFVTFGTILYFFNKNGWSRSDRIGKPVTLNQSNRLEVEGNTGGSQA